MAVRLSALLPPFFFNVIFPRCWGVIHLTPWIIAHRVPNVNTFFQTFLKGQQNIVAVRKGECWLTLCVISWQSDNEPHVKHTLHLHSGRELNGSCYHFLILYLHWKNGNIWHNVSFPPMFDIARGGVSGVHLHFPDWPGSQDAQELIHPTHPAICRHRSPYHQITHFSFVSLFGLSSNICHFHNLFQSSNILIPKLNHHLQPPSLWNFGAFSFIFTKKLYVFFEIRYWLLYNFLL